MRKISMKVNESLTIKEGVEGYLRWCKLNNYSEDIINYYERIIHSFSLFCDLDMPLEELTEELIENYMLYLREKDLSSETVQTDIRGLNTIIMLGEINNLLLT